MFFFYFQRNVYFIYANRKDRGDISTPACHVLLEIHLSRKSGMNFSTSWAKPLLPKDGSDYDVKNGIYPTTKPSDDTETTYVPMSELWPFFCDDNDTWCLYNDTSWVSNSTVEVTTDLSTINTTGNFTQEDITQYKYWSLLLLIFPLFTVFGNVLVVMSVVRERQLKTATNYFICSLAVADIMVAVVVMPPAVYLEVRLSQRLI